MTRSGDRPGVRVPRWEVLCVGAVALLVYWGLAQSVLYGDAPFHILLAREGVVAHKNHLAYLPLLHGAHALLHPFGANWHDTGQWLSHAGAAAGIAGFYYASRLLGAGRLDALLIAGLVAWSPSVLFFATLMEIHAPFLGMVGLSAVAVAHLARRPSPVWAAILGLTTALAFLVHAAGILLPLPLLVLFLARAIVSRRSALILCAVSITTHCALIAVLPALLAPAGSTAGIGATLRYLVDFSAHLLAHPGRAFEVALGEWLLPFAPTAVVWLVAFARPPLRREAVGLLVSVTAYLGAAMLTLGQYDEFGAYLQPLAWLAAGLVVASLPRAVTLLVLLGTAAFACYYVGQHDDGERALAYADGYRAVAVPRPNLLLITTPRELDACLVELRDDQHPFQLLLDFHYMKEVKPKAALERDLRALDDRMAAVWQHGGAVYLSIPDDPTSTLLSTPYGGLHAAVEHLRRRYQFEAVSSGEFRGFRLTPP